MRRKSTFKKSLFKILAFTLMFGTLLFVTTAAFTPPLALLGYSLVLGIFYERLDEIFEYIKDRY
jgi:hypothetical protein